MSNSLPVSQTAMPLRSWRWLLPCAAIPLVALLILSALGGKDSIQMLTGIQPFSEVETILGFLYLLSYLALTLLSPVFVLAAIMSAGHDAWLRLRTDR